MELERMPIDLLETEYFRLMNLMECTDYGVSSDVLIMVERALDSKLTAEKETFDCEVYDEHQKALLEKDLEDMDAYIEYCEECARFYEGYLN